MPSVVTFIAYDIEKRVSKYPEKFGTGVIEGVASPEAANNANCQAGFIPLFALGIPTTPIAAMLLASLMIYGLPVGPMLFKQHGDFAWTVVASMYIGNVMLLILNLPLVGLWARLCLIPYRIIGPIVLGAVMVGAYSIRNSMFDVWSAILFGLAGYVMKKRGWPIAPAHPGVYPGPPDGAALSGIHPGIGRFPADFPAATGLRRLYCPGGFVDPDEPEALFEGFRTGGGRRFEMSRPHGTTAGRRKCGCILMITE